MDKPSVWIVLMLFVNAAVFGYLAFGMGAVGHVAQVFLVVAVCWILRQIVLEYWETLQYQYRRNKALTAWAKQRRARRMNLDQWG